MDTQQQNFGALMAGMGMVMFLVIAVIFAFIIFLFWRIFTKAGMSGALAFLLVIPGIGSLIVLCILAFGQWKVVPVADASYPPLGAPPNYPPIGSGQ
jgi:hypothetical protein